MRTRAVAGLVVAGVIGGAGAGALVAGAASGPKDGTLQGVLLGKNEIGTDGKKRAGDLDGRGGGTAVIDAEANQLCFGLTVKDIGQPIAAHIHRGTKGENGPIVVGLSPPTAGDPGASSGCVDVDPALARAIAKNPRKYYWNVHTQDFPAGAVRGQVTRKRN